MTLLKDLISVAEFADEQKSALIQMIRHIIRLEDVPIVIRIVIHPSTKTEFVQLGAKAREELFMWINKTPVIDPIRLSSNDFITLTGTPLSTPPCVNYLSPLFSMNFECLQLIPIGQIFIQQPDAITLREKIQASELKSPQETNRGKNILKNKSEYFKAFVFLAEEALSKGEDSRLVWKKNGILKFNGEQFANEILDRRSEFPGLSKTTLSNKISKETIESYFSEARNCGKVSVSGQKVSTPGHQVDLH